MLGVLLSFHQSKPWACILFCSAYLTHSTYDIMWREAMMELLDQLEAENPENPALAPKVSTTAELGHAVLQPHYPCQHTKN